MNYSMLVLALFMRKFSGITDNRHEAHGLLKTFSKFYDLLLSSSMLVELLLFIEMIRVLCFVCGVCTSARLCLDIL